MTPPPRAEIFAGQGSAIPGNVTAMFLWLSAICILGVVALVGFYQGAIRAACSFLGLFIASALALPLAVIPATILPAFGIKHAVLLAFLPPVLMFIILMALVKTGAFMLHRKAETYYKYKASDTQRGLWERMNHRVGICVGLANGVVYLFLIGILLNIPGYASVQLASSDQEHWSLKGLNVINRDIQSTRFDQALAPFNPATDFYYDSVDTLSYIFHTPLLQQRLSVYPVFLPLAEESRFQEMAKDTQFQQVWLKQPSLGEFLVQPHIQPLVQDPEFYTNVVGLLEGDVTDLKGYLESNVSGKYGDEPLLGPWTFNYSSTYNLARRNKPNMPLAEKQYLANLLRATWNDSVLVAYLNNSLQLKRRSGSTLKGRWKREYGSKYTLTLTMDGQSTPFEAVIDGRRITVSQDKLSLVFKK
jgi:hypothetical protein